MLKRLRRTRGDYPSQFWLLFGGMLVSTMGASMIWPFLTIYLGAQLDIPLTQVGTLLTINAVAVLLSSLVAGPVTDRAGRKWVMVIGLLSSGIVYLGFNFAASWEAFAGLMALRGLLDPLYRVGANAMVADLIPEKKRIDVYALLRMSSNLGIALGPALGGFLSATSYTITFFLGSAGLVLFALALAVFAHETLPDEARQTPLPDLLKGLVSVFRDKPFITFIGAFALTQVAATMVWTLMAYYAKVHYSLSESMFGFIPMTNALMVVLLQVAVTNATKRLPPLPVMGVGGFLYALGVGSVALGHGFWGFWGSMVILTLGELMLVPTASTYTANLAPADKRGRYMSLYSLTWGVASGIGPQMGGVLNDQFAPVTVWYGGGLAGLLGAASFLWQGWAARHWKRILTWVGVLLALAAVIVFVLSASLPGTHVEGCSQGCATAVEREPGPLRVLSLNVLHGRPDFATLVERMDLIAAEINRLDADIVLLQEVPTRWELRGSGTRDLAEAAGMNYLYLRANGNRSTIFFEEGEAILSRFPLENPHFTELQPRAGFFEHRVVLGATAQTPWGAVQVFVTHLTHGVTGINAQQAADLQSYVAAHAGGFALVGGDFNARPDSLQIKTLAPVWVDAYLSMHLDDSGMTCCVKDLEDPNQTYQKRVDYLFFLLGESSAWQLTSAQIVINAPFAMEEGWLWASDHAGVFLEIIPIP